jgi:hypothetical protein
VSKVGQVGREEFELVQVVPLLGEWEAIFREDDGSEMADEVVGWALCRVTVDGKFTGTRLEPLVMVDLVGSGLSMPEPAAETYNFFGVRRKGSVPAEPRQP